MDEASLTRPDSRWIEMDEMDKMESIVVLSRGLVHDLADALQVKRSSFLPTLLIRKPR
jgi:hypothetical protein